MVDITLVWYLLWHINYNLSNFIVKLSKQVKNTFLKIYKNTILTLKSILHSKSNEF